MGKHKQKEYILPAGVTIKEPKPEHFTTSSTLTFVDEKYGEFITTLRGLLDAGISTHPLAVKERREQTNLARYGMKNAGGTKEARKKASKTMKVLYGVEHALKSEEFLNKSKETLFRNFNVTNPMYSEEIKNKYKNNFITQHGVDNPMKKEELKNKLRSSLLTKYGTDNVMFVPSIRAKQLEAVTNAYLASKRLNVLPNNLNVTEYCMSKESKPCPQHANRIFERFGPVICQKWIDGHEFKISSLEIKFGEFYKDIFPVRWNKKVSNNFGFRPDFIINDSTGTPVYVDVDGLVSHSEKRKQNMYHLWKRESYENDGKRLLQFRQDEIIFKQDIVHSILRAKLGLIQKKFYARKLDIKAVDMKHAYEFLEQNHLMGGIKTGKCIGLFNGEDLLFLIVYKKEKNGIELSRVVTKKNIIVTGGLNRLLKYIVNKENPSFIQSFVDLRYGNGESLKKTGFQLEGITLGWAWTNGVFTYNRRQCRANMDDRRLSQREYAKEKGWYKIYDAGQAKFILRLK